MRDQSLYRSNCPILVPDQQAEEARGSVPPETGLIHIEDAFVPDDLPARTAKSVPTVLCWSPRPRIASAFSANLSRMGARRTRRIARFR